MEQNNATPTAREARDAERCNVFLCALLAMAVIGMFGGLLFAKSWVDLIIVVGVSVWAVLGILALAFIAGACRWRRNV
jgi:hypothetical protein